MRSDFNNPFAKLPERSFVTRDKTIINVELRVLASLTGDWLNRIEKSSMPLTAVFNRSCRGKTLRFMLVGAETDLGISPLATASLETRLLAVAEVAEKKDYEMAAWDTVLPRLKAISKATANQSEWNIANTARLVLRDT
jgi:hypothetical protein